MESASISVKPENPNVPRSSADKVPSCAAGDFQVSGQVLQNTLSLCTEYLAKRSFYRVGKVKKNSLSSSGIRELRVSSFLLVSGKSGDATGSCNPSQV